MNDICYTSKLLKTNLFADFTHIKMLKHCVKQLYSELNEVCNWFKANKLSLIALKK